MSADARLATHRAREDPKTIPADVRQAVLDRDNAQCVLCGTGGENRLQLHHVVYRSQGGAHRPENLVVVCMTCHESIHRGDTDVLLLELTPGEWSAFPAMPRRRTT